MNPSSVVLEELIEMSAIWLWLLRSLGLLKFLFSVPMLVMV